LSGKIVMIKKIEILIHKIASCC